MRRIITTLLICGALLSAACGDKEAREYAQQLAGVLKSYKAEINKKIKAEQEAGNKQAAIYAYAQRTDALLTLDNDRFRRASLLAESLVQNAKLSPSDIQRLLADYAKQDFEATRVIFEQEADDHAAQLTGVATLELQAQSIDALIAALEEMARPDSRLAQLQAAGQFAVKFKEKLDELRCQDLARALKCREAQLAAATGTAKTRLENEIKLLKQRLADDQCAATLVASATCQN